MNEQRVRFGARLRQQREAKALTVPDVVKLTKIPEKSVNSLEGGVFEELPAEVFVRGFIKSYCRAVGMDSETALLDYEELVHEKKPRVASLARLGQMRNETSQVTPITGLGTPTPTASAAAPAPPEKTAAEKEKEREREKEREEQSVFSALADAGKGTGRMGLTVAVIVLVIVATLTLSLLLRRPGRAGVGDGVSAADTPATKIA